MSTKIIRLELPENFHFNQAWRYNTKLHDSKKIKKWIAELTFKLCEDAMIFFVLIFTFRLEPTVREQLDENDFRHYYGNFFESTILKLPDHSFVHSYDNDLWKTPYSWKFYGHGSL